MASLQVTARKAQQALKGQAVRVYLNQSETVTDLPNIVVGDVVGVVNGGNQGRVISVDSYGTSFLAVPVSPAGTLASGDTPGYLKNGELVNIN